MGRKFGIVAVGLLCATIFAGSLHPHDHDRIRLIDLTEEFGVFWQAQQNESDEQKIAAFYEHFDQLFPGFYRGERGQFAEGQYDTFLLAAIERYPEERTAISDVATTLQDQLEPALESFESQLGLLDGIRPVYLVHSLGVMDGGTRDLGGTTLIFGADTIARVHGSGNPQPFFHHELFHVYHDRYFDGCGDVWCRLWIEGLAVYVAASLNPNANDAQLLLGRRDSLRTAVNENPTQAYCGLVQRLDSHAEEDMRSIFSTERFSETLPGRFGYYAGYQAAIEIGRARSLSELSQLSPQEVRPLLEEALRNLGDCSND